jgi:hypothetical protein
MWTVLTIRQNHYLYIVRTNMKELRRNLLRWVVLSLGSFCALVRFVPWVVLSLGRFLPWAVLSLGRFELGPFCACVVS